MQSSAAYNLPAFGTTAYHYLDQIIDLLSFGLPFHSDIADLTVHVAYAPNHKNFSATISNIETATSYFTAVRDVDGTFIIKEQDIDGFTRYGTILQLPKITYSWDNNAVMVNGRMRYGFSWWITNANYGSINCTFAKTHSNALRPQSGGAKQDHWANTYMKVRQHGEQEILRIHFNYLRTSSDAIKCRI